MIARVRKSMDDKEQGFTLIELLVVIIIIGILSAIAIPVFLNQRKKAVDAGIKSDLRTVANEEETYFTDNQSYNAVSSAVASGVTTITITTGNPVTLSKNNVVVVATNSATTPTAYCIHGTNPGGTDTTNGWYYISSKGGLQPNGTTSCGTY